MTKFIEDYIAEFLPELLSLRASGVNNMILGGSLVLQFHGLTLGWEPQDLDVIIYKPEPFQSAIVKNPHNYASCTDYGIDVPEPLKSAVVENNIRSYRLKRNGLSLNVILEDSKAIPRNYLIANIPGFTWQFFVNSIGTILEAKGGYRSGQGNFIRSKDVLHFQLLKNNNFNF